MPLRAMIKLVVMYQSTRSNCRARSELGNQETTSTLVQDSGSVPSDRPKGHASIAFIEQQKVKVYFNDSIPYLLEDVGGQKANEQMHEFIELKGILKVGRFGSSVAIPIPHHKGYSINIGVLCIDGTSCDQFVGIENDHKLDQIARLVSVIMEIQSFFNDLSTLSSQL